MKKLKFLFWLVFIGFFVLLVYQNLEFFSTKNSLQIDLWFRQYATQPLTNGVIIAGFVGIGVFIMLLLYFSSRYTAYKANRIIKELRSNLEERTNAIASLKEELETIKQGGAVMQDSLDGDQDQEPQVEASETQAIESSQV
jgi:uncharacterized membrane protein YciS (DUF1049 family)